MTRAAPDLYGSPGRGVRLEPAVDPAAAHAAGYRVGVLAGIGRQFGPFVHPR